MHLTGVFIDKCKQYLKKSRAIFLLHHFDTSSEKIRHDSLSTHYGTLILRTVQNHFFLLSSLSAFMFNYANYGSFIDCSNWNVSFSNLEKVSLPLKLYSLICSKITRCLRIPLMLDVSDEKKSDHFIITERVVNSPIK